MDDRAFRQNKLTSCLNEALFQTEAEGETAKRLLECIPEIVKLMTPGSRSDLIENEVFASRSFRSKLLLLVSIARLALIRYELELLASFRTHPDLVVGSGRRAETNMIDDLDHVRSQIISWKDDVRPSFMSSRQEKHSERSAFQHGPYGISGKIRWN